MKEDWQSVGRAGRGRRADCGLLEGEPFRRLGLDRLARGVGVRE